MTKPKEQWIIVGACILNLLACGLAWFPMQIVPSYHWSGWIPASFIFASATSAALLMGSKLWLVPLCACCGVLLASIVGYRMFWPTDPVAIPWIPIGICIFSVQAFLIGAIGAVLGGQLTKRSKTQQRMLAVGVLCSLALLSSLAIVGNDELIKRKISRNQHLAEIRMRAIYRAATKAAEDRHDPRAALDYREVVARYRGPTFSEHEWMGMTRNFLRRNGYVYQVRYSLVSPGEIVVVAHPIDYRDQVRESLCLDKSGQLKRFFADSQEQAGGSC